jgi:tetratricopeptide (TPR) repeat protein
MFAELLLRDCPMTTAIWLAAMVIRLLRFRDYTMHGRRAWTAAALPLAMIAGSPALATDWDSCGRLSFAPLDQNVPACTRILEANDLTDDRVIAALLARSRAYEFAVTYHRGHTIDKKHLIEKAVADLDRVVTIARKQGGVHSTALQQALQERAALSLQLGQPERAVRDYTSVMQAPGGRIAPVLHGRARAWAAMGRYDEAIADLDELIRAFEGTSNHHNRIFDRGEMHEAAGNRQAAIEDFRRTLELDPNHGAARAALERLKSSAR